MYDNKSIGMVGGGVASIPAPSIPPVHRAIDGLEMVTDRLSDDVMMLLDRLAPVSAPVPQTAGNDPRPPAACAVEDRVSAATARLHNIAAAIRNAREALCI